jgi:hypothetical protein
VLVAVPAARDGIDRLLGQRNENPSTQPALQPLNPIVQMKFMSVSDLNVIFLFGNLMQSEQVWTAT